MVVTRPEDIYLALEEGYNSGDLEAVVSLYDPKAVFVIKPGRVTQNPAELHSALTHLVALGGRLTVNPRTFIRSDDLVLVLGTFTLCGRRGDGTPFERTSGSQTCCGASRTAVGSWPSIIPMVMTKIHLAVTHRPHLLADRSTNLSTAPQN